MCGSLRAGAQIGFDHCRVETHIGGQSFSNTPALIKYRYAVTKAHDQFDVMFDQKNRCATLQNAFKQSA
jgi:hypothetical protein